METDLRYSLEHVGDLFIEKLERVIKSVTGQFRGIVVTHDIHSMERKRHGLMFQIGERVVTIRKDNASLFTDDPAMNGLFSQLDDLDGRLDAMINEREERLNRIRGRISDVIGDAVEVTVDEGTADLDMQLAPA